MRISEFINPDEFQRFCSVLFSAEFKDFESIDDSGGDLGIDGYIQDDKVFQIYCPEKPQKITDSKIKEKIKNSIKKAINTIKDRQLKATNFVFVTSMDLRTEVILFLGQECKNKGFKGLSYGESKLTELLLRHSHVKKDFPFLLLPEISDQIGEVSKKVNKVEDILLKMTRGASKTSEKEAVILRDVRLKESIDAYNNGDVEKMIKLSREVYYDTSDPEVKLQAIINIVLHSVDPNKTSYYIELCQEGIDLADRLKSVSTKSVLMAQKASLIQREADLVYMDLWWWRQVADRTGFFNESEYISKARLFKDELEEVEKLFKEAIDTAYKNGYYSALAHIYSTAGNSAGLSYIARGGKTYPSSAGFYESRCKTALLEAKRIFEAIGDKEGALNTLHNLANNLKSFGEKELSEKYANEVLEKAEKYKFFVLMDKAKELLYALKHFTDKDYEIPPEEFLKKIKERQEKIKREREDISK